LSSLPVTYGERAKQDLVALPPELRLAVLEQLTRIAVNYQTCSRRSAFPRPPGWESGLWVRYPDARATLVEVLFLITAEPDGITVRRVLVTPVERLPGWVVNPAEWTGQPPWPVIDL
jgi:hypothetical protein